MRSPSGQQQPPSRPNKNSSKKKAGLIRPAGSKAELAQLHNPALPPANPSDRGERLLDPRSLPPCSIPTRYTHAPAAARAPPPRLISRLLYRSPPASLFFPINRASSSLPCAPSGNDAHDHHPPDRPFFPFLPWPLSLPCTPSLLCTSSSGPPAPWSPPRPAALLPLCRFASSIRFLLHFSIGPFLPSVTSLWGGN